MFRCRRCGHKHHAVGGKRPRYCSVCEGRNFTHLHEVAADDGHPATAKESIFPFSVLTIALFVIVGLICWANGGGS